MDIDIIDDYKNIRDFMNKEVYYDIEIVNFEQSKKEHIKRQRLKFDYHLKLDQELDEKFLDSYLHLQKVHQRLEVLTVLIDTAREERCKIFMTEMKNKLKKIEEEEGETYEFGSLIQGHHPQLKIQQQIHAYGILRLFGLEGPFDDGKFFNFDEGIKKLSAYLLKTECDKKIFLRRVISYEEGNIIKWINQVLYQIWGIYITKNEDRIIKGLDKWSQIITKYGIKLVPIEYKPREEIFNMTIEQELTEISLRKR